MSHMGHDGPAVPPAGGARRPEWPATPPPHRALGGGDPAEVGPYRLEAVLGSGGMGRVYLGRTPAGSEVAVKLVHREYAGDRAFRRRFEQEVAAARRVQGLYTVPVVDADLRADEPWLATAYVPGPSLQHAVDENGPLPADAASALTARVAEALQSIHAAGVIHRDLKPSNIILTADGPKVIDFGIARAADVTSITGTGMRAGTPAYMAPEYIRGQDLTEAVDVFALGLVAHFAATGRLAFGGGSHHAVTYRILEQDPDLDGCPEPVRTVAARCLEKTPRQRPAPADVIRLCRRTPTAADAGGDLHSAPTRPAHPVAPAEPPALPPTRQATAQSPPAAPPAAYAPSPYAALGASAEGLPGGKKGWAAIGGGLLVAALLVFFLPGADEDGGSARWFKPMTTLSGEDSVNAVAFSPDGKTLATGVQDGKIRLLDAAGHRRRDTLSQHGEDGREEPLAISSLAFSPDGRVLAASAGDGTVGLWDLSERRQTALIVASTSHPLRDVAFSPDGELLATGSEDGRVRLWHTDGRKKRHRATLDHGVPVWEVEFSPDGRTVASAAYDPAEREKPSATIWDLADNTSRRTLPHPEAVTGVAFSRDSTTLFTGSSDGRIRRWDVPGGQEGDALTAGPVSTSTGVEVSPDGELLASADAREVYLWDLGEDELRAVLTGHESSVEDMAFAPRSRFLATVDDEGKVRLWQPAKTK